MSTSLCSLCSLWFVALISRAGAVTFLRARAREGAAGRGRDRHVGEMRIVYGKLDLALDAAPCVRGETQYAEDLASRGAFRRYRCRNGTGVPVDLDVDRVIRLQALRVYRHRDRVAGRSRCQTHVELNIPRLSLCSRLDPHERVDRRDERERTDDHQHWLPRPRPVVPVAPRLPRQEGTSTRDQCESAQADECPEQLARAVVRDGFGCLKLDQPNRRGNGRRGEEADSEGEQPIDPPIVEEDAGRKGRERDAEKHRYRSRGLDSVAQRGTEFSLRESKECQRPGERTQHRADPASGFFDIDRRALFVVRRWWRGRFAARKRIVSDLPPVPYSRRP